MNKGFGGAQKKCITAKLKMKLTLVLLTMNIRLKVGDTQRFFFDELLGDAGPCWLNEEERQRFREDHFLENEFNTIK